MKTTEATTICEICGQAGGVIDSYLVGDPTEREAWAHAECLDAVSAGGGVIEPDHVGEYDECGGCAQPGVFDHNGGAQEGRTRIQDGAKTAISTRSFAN